MMHTSSPSHDERAWRPGKVIAGIVCGLLGVVGALALWLAGEQRYDDGVAALARAPVGCETVLAIEEPGELLNYAEAVGRFDDTAGDCAASGAFAAATQTPTVNVDVTGPDGDPLAVQAASGSDYDRGGFAGSQVGRVRVAEAGDHLVRVASDDGEFALAIGNDPSDGVVALRAGALIALVAGFVLGVLLLVAGRRPQPSRRDVLPVPTTPAQVPEWWTTGQAVKGPPQRPAAPPRVPGQPAGPGWPIVPEQTGEAPASPWGPPDRSESAQ